MEIFSEPQSTQTNHKAHKDHKEYGLFFVIFVVCVVQIILIVYVVQNLVIVVRASRRRPGPRASRSTKTWTAAAGSHRLV